MTALAIQCVVIVAFGVFAFACYASEKKYQLKSNIFRIAALSANICFASFLVPFVIEIFYSPTSTAGHLVVDLCVAFLCIVILINYKNLYTVSAVMTTLMLGFILGLPATVVTMYVLGGFLYHANIMHILEIGIPDFNLIELFSLTGAALIFFLLTVINHIVRPMSALRLHIHVVPMYAAIALSSMAAYILALLAAARS